MEVTVDKAEGLERRIKVQVPAERVEGAVDEKLREVGRSAKISGFRPGKVPLKVLRQRFGANARQEVAEELLKTTVPQALQETELQPAGQPRVELDDLTPNAGLTYTAVIDVLPEFELQGLEGAALEQPGAEVTDDDVEKTLQRMRDQNKTSESVEREAGDGDQVRIDFRGTLDGEEFDGNSGEDVELEIGSGRLLEEMEAGLKGHKAGEEFAIEATFPEDYGVEHLRGETAVFQVSLKEVAETRLPELNEAFAGQMGVQEGGVEALRDKVRASLEKEKHNAARDYVKKQVMDTLMERNPIDLPESMVSDEIERMREEALQHMPSGQGQDLEKMRQMLPGEMFREGARRRVHLSLLMNAVKADKGLEQNRERIEAKLAELAGGYEQAEEVKRYYRSNRETMQGIEAMAMEDQVVDTLAESAQMNEVSYSLDELLEKRQSQQMT
jgi:trigger factor